MNTLLAIDLGIRMGWASYTEDGSLTGFGSHNYLSQPKTLMDDAAEAILIGFWGCLQTGWIKQ